MVQIAVRNVLRSACLPERSWFSKHSAYFGEVSVNFFSSRRRPCIILGRSLADTRVLNRLVLTKIGASLVRIISPERIRRLVVLLQVVIIMVVLNTGVGCACAGRMQTSIAGWDCHRIRKLDIVHERLNISHVNLRWACSRFGHNLGVVKVANGRISYPLCGITSILVCRSTSTQSNVLSGLTWARSVRICDSLMHRVTNVLHRSARSQSSYQSEIAWFASFNRNRPLLTYRSVTGLSNDPLGLMLRIKGTWNLIGLASCWVVGSSVGSRSLHQLWNDTLLGSHEVVSFEHAREHIVRGHVSSRRASSWVCGSLILFNGACACCVCLRSSRTSRFLSMNYIYAGVMSSRVLIWSQLMNEAVCGALRRFRWGSLVVCGECLNHEAVLTIV